MTNSFFIDNKGLLQNSTILFLNQTRIRSVNVIPGKGFYESLQWAKYFKRVFFVCFSETDSLQIKKIGPNYTLIAFPFDMGVSTFSTFKKIAHNYIILLKNLSRLIKKFNIEIIRSENLIFFGMVAFLLNKIFHIPNLIWLGGFERKAIDSKYGHSILTSIGKMLVFLLEYFLLNLASGVVTVSDELYTLLNQRGVKHKFLIPNYVDFSLFNSRPILPGDTYDFKTIKLLYAGRLEKEKGIQVLIQALGDVIKQFENFELELVGDGSLREWILEYAKKNSLISRIQLKGTVSFQDMPQIYKAADIFVLPSYTEGMSASLSEAMASGCACICTNVGMNHVLINSGRNGLMIEPGNPKILAQTIISLLKNPRKIAAFGQNARHSIEAYSAKFMATNVKIFHHILKIH